MKSSNQSMLKFENVAFFDVDETLVLWRTVHEPDTNFVCPHTGVIESGTAHKEHVERIKQHKKLGHTVIVWSAGGMEWASRAVEALGVKEYVDICMEKPIQYYDDITADEFMGSRTYVGSKKYDKEIVTDYLDRY